MTRPRMVAILVLAAVPIAHAAAPPTWYVTTAPTPDPNAQTRVTLDAEERTVDAGSEWSCTISPPATLNARTTTCRKAREAVEFSVQCSAHRNEDHIQIRFRDAAGSQTFIEVGCQTGE
jgi:hypothetical protein